MIIYYSGNLKINGAIKIYTVSAASPPPPDPFYSFFDYDTQFGVSYFNSYNITQDSQPKAMFFHPNGSTMFLVGDATDKVYQYSLSTPWDITTLSYTGKSFAVSAQITSMRNMYFRPDGMKMFISRITPSPGNVLVTYDLANAWDLSGAITFNTLITALTIFTFDSTGTKVQVHHSVYGGPSTFILTSAWSSGSTLQSTVSFDESALIDSSVINNIFSITFDTSGERLFSLMGSADPVRIDDNYLPGVFMHYANRDESFSSNSFYVFDSFFQIYPNSAYTVSAVTRYSDLKFSTNGNSMYVLETSPSARIHQFNLSRPFSFRGNVKVTAETIFTIPPPLRNYSFINRIFFSNDGSLLFLQLLGNTIKKLSLSTPWDITTMVDTSSSLHISGIINEIISDFAFNPDGTKLFVTNASLDSPAIYSFALLSAWDITTVTSASSEVFVFPTSAMPYRITCFTINSSGDSFYFGTGDDRLVKFVTSSAWSVSDLTLNRSLYPIGNNLGGTGINSIIFNRVGDTCLILNSTVTQYNTLYPYKFNNFGQVSAKAFTFKGLEYRLGEYAVDPSPTIFDAATDTSGKRLFFVDKNNSKLYTLRIKDI